jgi:hypothetical protein
MVNELVKSDPLVVPEVPEGVDAAVVPFIEATLTRHVQKRPAFEQVVKFGHFRDPRAVDEKPRAGEMRKRAGEDATGEHELLSCFWAVRNTSVCSV